MVAVLLLYGETLPALTIGLVGSSIVLATVVWGALLEHHRWAWPLEAVRVGLLVVAASTLLATPG